MNGGSLSYTTSLTDEQFEQAVGLINSVRPLDTTPSRRERLHRAPFKVAAIDDVGNVVGVAAIKSVVGEAGEAGFLTVRLNFRRRGIASTLTRLRIEHARSIGLKTLCANARTSNVASRNLLHRTGYVHYADFLSSFGSARIISWYYLPLDENCDPHTIMKGIVGGLTPAT